VRPGVRWHGHRKHRRRLGHGLGQDEGLARVQLLRGLDLVRLSMN
jgi:hypothetical protein